MNEREMLMKTYRDQEDAIKALPERWRKFAPILNTYVQIVFDSIRSGNLSVEKEGIQQVKLALIDYVLNNLGFEIVSDGSSVAVCPMGKRKSEKRVGRRIGQRKNA